MSIIPSVLGQRTSIFDPFNLDIWDPSEDFPIPLTEILSTSHSNLANEASAFANTRIDWKETPEAHIIKADLLGLSKEVHVQVEEGNILQIREERKKEKEEKNEKWHRVERSIGKFVRRFRLPDNAKVDEMNATMENGVLTITLPKEEVKKPDVKSVEVSD